MQCVVDTSVDVFVPFTLPAVLDSRLHSGHALTFPLRTSIDVQFRFAVAVDELVDAHSRLGLGFSHIAITARHSERSRRLQQNMEIVCSASTVLWKCSRIVGRFSIVCNFLVIWNTNFEVFCMIHSSNSRPGSQSQRCALYRENDSLNYIPNYSLNIQWLLPEDVMNVQ